MSEEKPNVPKLRFPGFADPWEQRKLGEIAEIVGGGTPNTSVEEYWDGDIDWYTPAELGDRRYVDSSLRKITQAGYDNSSARMLPANRTILFTSRAGIGNTAILCSSACTNQGFQSLVVGDSADVDFIYSLSDDIKRKAEIKASGSTFLEISGKRLTEIEVLAPALVEQVQIGSFFRQLDSLIALHQRKLDHLKEMKKGLLQKMFPKNGESIPELRFPGFADPWEQRKFSDLFSYERPDAYIVNNDEYDDSNPTPVLTANKGFILGYTAETRTHEGPCVIFDDFTLDCKLVTFPFMVKSSAMKILHCHDGVDLTFAYERLCSAKIEALGHARHYISVVQNTESAIPSYEEQSAIGRVLSNLDTLITLHQRKLDHLKQMKKGLLQQMFV